MNENDRCVSYEMIQMQWFPDVDDRRRSFGTPPGPELLLIHLAQDPTYLLSSGG